LPEGDTIYRSARTLDRALRDELVTDAGTTAAGVSGRDVGRLVGQAVAAVQPRGKHLLCWFDPSGLALHTHMRMSGSWHLYRHGERWRKSPGKARLWLATDELVAVCFAAPVCELLSAGEVADHPGLAGLGPDALGAEVDLDEAARRLDARGDWTVAEALLDQRVLAGIGNVYKCELCHIHRVSPWTRVDELAPEARAALLADAVRLLRANVMPGAAGRDTTDGAGGAPGGDRLHVYGEAGRPCPRCATLIQAARQGRQARMTYFCPGCQS
jgi:endonuclease-8